ncbi:MAG: hypothetical protein ABI675_05595 [Chitinophagaceae bacterium]
MMQELQVIYDEYKSKLQGYAQNKTTIPGRLRWETFKSETLKSFADDIDKRCKELDAGNSDELKKEANRLFNQLRSL